MKNLLSTSEKYRLVFPGMSAANQAASIPVYLPAH